MTRIGDGGRAAEKRLAKRIGGRQTPASGASGSKGDVEVGTFLIESKATEQRSMAIALEWLVKISREAAMKGRTPAVAINFIKPGPGGQPWPGGSWIMMPEHLFRELTETDSGATTATGAGPIEDDAAQAHPVRGRRARPL